MENGFIKTLGSKVYEMRIYEKYPGQFEETIKDMEDRIKEIEEEKRILLSNIEDLKEALKD